MLGPGLPSVNRSYMGGFIDFRRFKIKICYFHAKRAQLERWFLLSFLYYLLYLDTLDNYHVHNSQFWSKTLFLFELSLSLVIPGYSSIHSIYLWMILYPFLTVWLHPVTSTCTDRHDALNQWTNPFIHLSQPRPYTHLLYAEQINNRQIIHPDTGQKHKKW